MIKNEYGRSNTVILKELVITNCQGRPLSYI